MCDNPAAAFAGLFCAIIILGMGPLMLLDMLSGGRWVGRQNNHRPDLEKKP